jgi:transglutaminase-like putative cysteine protease
VTAIADRPAPAPGAPAPRPAASAPAPATGLTSYLVPAEVSLVLLTLATVIGFGRVFADWSFLGPMIATALYTHGVCLVTRRRGYSVPVSGLIALPGFVLLCSWVFFFERTTLGIPTGSTVSAANEALSASWDAFQNVVAPAPPLTGFVMASCAALFFAIFLADWAGFRLWSAFEAIVPASTLFIFCSLLGSNQLQIMSSVIFAAALFSFLLCHRIARQETSAGWLTADIARGSKSLAMTGLCITAVAVVLGAVVAPRLPGAGSPAKISWRGQEAGPGSRTTISPLVDIQDRLVSQSDVELFTVKSPERAYWRMTSLDTFEGDIWKSSGKYTAADGDLDAPVPDGVKTSTATQSYSIENLRVLWLPAAFEPLHVESPNADVRYQSESSTLIVDTSVADSDGLAYEVTSALPRFTAEQLKTADASMPKDAQHYLDLPPGFSQLARRTALEQTAAGTDPYTKARLLQDYFHGKDFSYNLKVNRGHSTNAIDDFLNAKEGYCEQYAGTYAAMARAIGLPSRVAVGFTPGESSGSGLYTVRGEHAHAWPEVYLGQFGWVAFEPTPGRGAPNAEAYTGLAEQQDTTGPANTATTVAGTSVTPSTVTTLVPDNNGTAKDLLEVVPNTPTTPPTPDERSWIVGAAVYTAALLLFASVLIAVYVVVVLWLKHSRHEHRRARAATSNARVRVAWDESVEALGRARVRPDPTETHEEFATRVEPVLGDDVGPAFLALARDVDAADYAPQDLPEHVADRATDVASAVGGVVDAGVGPTRRAFDRLDPRPLLPERGIARRSASGRQTPALPL